MATIQELNQEREQILKDFNAYNDPVARKEFYRRLRENEAKIVQQLDIKVGTVFYESWGYDQTNIDFCEVVTVSPTKKTVLCRMIGKKQVETASVAPDNTWKGEEIFRLKVSQYNGEIKLRGTYPFCRGGTREGSFDIYTKPVYETPFGMGH